MKRESENQSRKDITSQLVRYYQIPVDSEKGDVLDTILSRINTQIHTYTRKVIPLSVTLFAELAAAVALIAVALHFFTATVTFSGENGESLCYRFPDHSRVILQSNSQVRFKKHLWKRKISLNGTAYFEVEKGSRFQVNTPLGKVEVLGTRFLVSNQEDSLNVLCYTGSVKTSTKQRSVILEPGMQFWGTKTSGEMEPVTIQKDYPDFAKFNQSFPGVSLSNVIEDIETFFGVQIDIKNGNGRSFSGTIQTGNLDTALEIVCRSMQLKYRYTNKYRIEII